MRFLRSPHPLHVCRPRSLRHDTVYVLLALIQTVLTNDFIRLHQPLLVTQEPTPTKFGHFIRQSARILALINEETRVRDLNCRTGLRLQCRGRAAQLLPIRPELGEAPCDCGGEVFDGVDFLTDDALGAARAACDELFDGGVALAGAADVGNVCELGSLVGGSGLWENSGSRGRGMRDL